MIYLVSNIHRSGSSMMMRCLESGGLIPVYDKEINLNDNAPVDYIPNPNGFYQFTSEITADFAKLHDGKLIKCPIRDLIKLPKWDYKVVFMYRNPAEIRASMGKWQPYQSWGQDEVITYFYEEYLEHLFEELRKRGDFDITVINYADVVANPVKEFTKLSYWGVDVEKMAAMVHPELYRLKLENL
jgi:hypothetical protein